MTSLLPALFLSFAAALAQSEAEPDDYGKGQFLYLSDQRVVTLEFVDPQTLIINYMSLGDAFEVLQAPKIVLFDVGRRARRAHLFLREDQSDAADRFLVSRLVGPGEVAGLDVKGSFGEGPFVRAVLNLGGRILDLERLAVEDFEIVMARLGEMDLGNQDRPRMLELAGFAKRFGRLLEPGTPEAAELDSQFPELERLAPVALTSPAPLLPPAHHGLKDPVVVQVRAAISTSGGVIRTEIVRGLNRELDERAMRTVRNSWTFLPAVSEGEVAQSEAVLNVVFRRDR